MRKVPDEDGIYTYLLTFYNAVTDAGKLVHVAGKTRVGVGGSGVGYRTMGRKLSDSHDHGAKDFSNTSDMTQVLPGDYALNVQETIRRNVKGWKTKDVSAAGGREGPGAPALVVRR